MGLFNRKRHEPQPEAPRPERTRMIGPTTLPGPPDEVVGESHYQNELEAICGRKCSQGYELAVLAKLFPEPETSYDKHAVAIIISSRKVGHLSEGDAVAYRSAIDRARREHDIATCAAKITGSAPGRPRPTSTRAFRRDR